jgi:hypothetical protein
MTPFQSTVEPNANIIIMVIPKLRTQSREQGYGTVHAYERWYRLCPRSRTGMPSRSCYAIQGNYDRSGTNAWSFLPDFASSERSRLRERRIVRWSIDWDGYFMKSLESKCLYVTILE